MMLVDGNVVIKDIQLHIVKALEKTLEEHVLKEIRAKFADMIERPQPLISEDELESMILRQFRERIKWNLTFNKEIQALMDAKCDELTKQIADKMLNLEDK